MSDTDEILEVFHDDIRGKEQQILNKSGIYPFINNLNGFQIEHIHGLDEDDLELLARIGEVGDEENHEED